MSNGLETPLYLTYMAQEELLKIKHIRVNINRATVHKVGVLICED